MSKSSRLPRSTTLRRGNGTAIIEVGHRITARRRAKIAFWTLLVGVGFMTTIVSSAIVGLELAIVIGLLIGLAVAGLGGAIAFCWPGIRVAWHWADAIGLFAVLLTCYALVATVLPWWVALLVMVSATAGPFGYPAVRRWLWPIVMCAVVRHRLRYCFTEFITHNRNRADMVPFILFATPTPAGERVTIWLRPGLSMRDLEERRERIAVACWAKEVRLTPASKTKAGLVHVHITRRNTLSTTVDSPLPGLVNSAGSTENQERPAMTVPSALNLADVPEPARMPINRDATRRRAVRAIEPEQSDPPPIPADDTVTDWI